MQEDCTAGISDHLLFVWQMLLQQNISSTQQECVHRLFFFSTLGGIQSTPVPAKFSFEVTAKIEVLCVHVSYSVAINCKTNDPSANVSLSLPTHLPSHNLPSLQGRLKRNGAIFTIQKAILHDGGKYYCVAEKNGKVIKREIYLYVAGTCGIFHSYIL